MKPMHVPVPGDAASKAPACFPARAAPRTAPASAGFVLQRKCACGNDAGSSGQCDRCRARQRVGLQAKDASPLLVGAHDDAFEQEADRTADRVLRGGTAAPPTHTGIRLQRAAQSPPNLNGAPPLVRQALETPGRPLESHSRSLLEPRFGHDFSHVRVHDGDLADRSAQSVGALAYTVGHHVVFARGNYAPDTHGGNRLLAHELTHVIQQQRGQTHSIQRAGGQLTPQRVQEVYGSWVQQILKARGTTVFNDAIDKAARDQVKKQVGPGNFASWERWEQSQQAAIEAKAEAENPKPADAEPFDPQAQLMARHAQMWADTESLRKEVVRVERAAAQVNFGGGVKGSVARGTAAAYTAFWGVGAKTVNSVTEHAPMLVLDTAGVALGSTWAERNMVEQGQAIKREGEEMGEDTHTAVRLASGNMQAAYEATRPSYNAYMKAFGNFSDASSKFKRDEDYIEQAKDIGAMNDAMKAMRESGNEFLMTCAKMGIETDAAALNKMGKHIVQASQDTVGNAVMSVAPELMPELRELKGVLKGTKGLGPKELEKEGERLLANALKEGEHGLSGSGAKSAVKTAENTGIKSAENAGLKSAEGSGVKSAEGSGVKSAEGAGAKSAEKSAFKNEAEAAKFVDEHPPKKFEGEPGKRHADLEGGHEIVETPGGGCELHSSPPFFKVPCPGQKGRKAFADDPNFKRDLFDEPGSMHGEEPHGGNAHEGHADLPEDRPGDMFDRTQSEIDRAAEARERGNTFNTEREGKYKHNEVTVDSPHAEDVGKGGKPKRYRVDSYTGKSIISRKFPEGQKFTTENATKYIAELADKYPPGTVISKTAKNEAAGLAGKKLRGKLVLEVPVLLEEVPREVLEFAERQGVQIRDAAGHIYNKALR